MGIWDEKTGSFVSFIRSQSAITALIGANDSCRCWPDTIRQGATLPALMYTRLGGERIRHLGGGTGKARTVLHVYCYASTRAGADALSRAVISALDNYRGTWTTGTITINDVQIFDAPTDGIDIMQDSSQDVRYWTLLPMAIIHSES